jgi:proteasome accessory factor B
MADQAERLINLALFLAGARGPVTADACRASVEGYPGGQDDAAFGRMFERDKELLRASGLALEVVTAGDVEAYRLAGAAFAPPIALTPDEVATLAAAGAAMLSDPSFPLAEDLRYALAKVSPSLEAHATAGTGHLADESPAAQGEAAALLTAAISARKRVGFGYVNAAGRAGGREVEPYGLFLREGRWYLVGRDRARDEVRTYTVGRMTGLRANAVKPKTPDFERPADFDTAAYVVLPFQYGPARLEAVVRFGADAAWRAERLTAGQGELTTRPDGGVDWRVGVTDPERFLRWIAENGPGVVPVAPPELRERLAEGLRDVVVRHDAR